MKITVDHEITDQDLLATCQQLRNRYGADFTNYEPKSLKRRFVRAFKKFELETVTDLWKAISKNEKFIFQFVDEITVGLTSMFRDPELWLCLKNMLPELYLFQQEVKIWHAGCSTGEEVATLSILLHEIEMLSKCSRLATDLNQSSIAKSAAGRFPSSNWAEYQKNYAEYRAAALLSDYFDLTNDHYTLRKELLKGCSFARHNLLTDPFRSEKYDLILCRNVMIYFETDVKKELVNKFFQALKPGGLFIVGYLDNMLPLMNESKFEMFNSQTKIFRKPLEQLNVQ